MIVIDYTYQADTAGDGHTKRPLCSANAALIQISGGVLQDAQRKNRTKRNLLGEM